MVDPVFGSWRRTKAPGTQNNVVSSNLYAMEKNAKNITISIHLKQDNIRVKVQMIPLTTHKSHEVIFQLKLPGEITKPPSIHPLNKLKKTPRASRRSPENGWQRKMIRLPSFLGPFFKRPIFRGKLLLAVSFRGLVSRRLSDESKDGWRSQIRCAE